jgi:type III secretion protein J
MSFLCGLQEQTFVFAYAGMKSRKRFSKLGHERTFCCLLSRLAWASLLAIRYFMELGAWNVVRLLVFSSFVAALAACAQTVVVHDIAEKESNDILVLLADNDIVASKVLRDTGREILYSIRVKESRKLDSLRILKSHDYPRRQIAGYGQVFAESGLIPTGAEEKAKKLRAIEGEIEKQLTLITGILDAQVNLVMPEESALRSSEEAQVPTTASVVIKYIADEGGVKPLSEPSVKSIVAAGVEKLVADRVEVRMSEINPIGRSKTVCPEVPSATVMGSVKQKQLRVIFAVALVAIVLMAVFLLFTHWRLRNVRSKYIRLQNEVAKARRRVPEGLPGAVS